MTTPILDPLVESRLAPFRAWLRDERKLRTIPATISIVRGILRDLGGSPPAEELQAHVVAFDTMRQQKTRWAWNLYVTYVEAHDLPEEPARFPSAEDRALEGTEEELPPPVVCHAVAVLIKVVGRKNVSRATWGDHRPEEPDGPVLEAITNKLTGQTQVFPLKTPDVHALDVLRTWGRPDDPTAPIVPVRPRARIPASLGRLMAIERSPLSRVMPPAPANPPVIGPAEPPPAKTPPPDPRRAAVPDCPPITRPVVIPMPTCPSEYSRELHELYFAPMRKTMLPDLYEQSYLERMDAPSKWRREYLPAWLGKSADKKESLPYLDQLEPDDLREVPAELFARLRAIPHFPRHLLARDPGTVPALDAPTPLAPPAPAVGATVAPNPPPPPTPTDTVAPRPVLVPVPAPAPALRSERVEAPAPGMRELSPRERHLREAWRQMTPEEREKARKYGGRPKKHSDRAGQPEKKAGKNRAPEKGRDGLRTRRPPEPGPGPEPQYEQIRDDEILDVEFMEETRLEFCDPDET